jgi:hypothetical protein
VNIVIELAFLWLQSVIQIVLAYALLGALENVTELARLTSSTSLLLVTPSTLAKVSLFENN